MYVFMKPRQKINNTQSGNRMQYVCNINMNQMFVHDSTEPLTHIHTKTHAHTGKKIHNHKNTVNTIHKWQLQLPTIERIILSSESI